MADQIVEVSIVFRGFDAEKNAEAFMLYMDTIEGMLGTINGIKHFGGCVQHITDEPENKLIIFDGDTGDEFDGDEVE